MQNKDRFTILWQGYLTNTLNAEEVKELLACLRSGEELQEEDIHRLLNHPPLTAIDPEAGASIYNGVLAMIRKNTPFSKPKPVWSLWKRVGAVASIVLLLGVSTYVWIIGNGKTPQETVQQNKDIDPGKEGAVLTLSNGTQIALDTIATGIVALQGGVTARVVNGALVYEGDSKEVVYNIMTTPRGRQYQLYLPDGTQVWLNAMSTIRYPTAFTGNERMVELTGEAYFDVAKHAKKPFMLQVNNKATVEVLGTQFNVHAYKNEQYIQTTLLEGSIKVFQSQDKKGLEEQKNNSASLHKAVILQPGQQAELLNSLNKSANIAPEPIKINTAIDIDKITAWKNGVFNFNGTELKDVMRALERWYDIDVVYEKEIPDIIFWGKIPKDLPLSSVLTALGKADVHFRLEGKTVIVLP